MLFRSQFLKFRENPGWSCGYQLYAGLDFWNLHYCNGGVFAAGLQDEIRKVHAGGVAEHDRSQADGRGHQIGHRGNICYQRCAGSFRRLAGWDILWPEVRKINYKTKVMFYGFNDNNDIDVYKRQITEKLYDEIKEIIQEKNSKNVLDLYCGTGTIGIYICESRCV